MNPRPLFCIFYLSVYKMSSKNVRYLVLLNFKIDGGPPYMSFRTNGIFFNSLYNAFNESTTILRNTILIISKFNSFFTTQHKKNKTEIRTKKNGNSTGITVFVTWGTVCVVFLFWYLSSFCLVFVVFLSCFDL